ncbi:MAG TPA: asparagine synthetase A [Candidatus Dojkabacteria bacterium]|nr:asparagine synthetase A [Candidatus Dojkabacteria bacterium]
MRTSIVNPPKSWRDSSSHYKEALNSPWYNIITKLQAEFVNATVSFYRTKSYDFVLLPITTGSISSPMGLGSDSSPIKVNIQGIDTYLADSMQFMLEYACRVRKNGCYYLEPSFRGEKADARHLCQFYHSEAEIEGSLDDVIKLVEDYVKYLAKWYLDNCKELLLQVTENTNHIENLVKIKNIPRVSFDQAVDILENNKEFITDHGKYRTINSNGEKALMDKYNGFVWLTNFDHLSVPFYQKSLDSKFKTAVNADLLMGIGETVGSGMRHFSREETEKALEFHKVRKEDYQWYLDMKEIVPMQTSGFGLGVERFLLWLTNQNDIRDMQLVPRFNGEKSVL